MVIASRRQGAAVGAEGDGADIARVTGQGLQLALGGHVPELDRVVLASRSQGAAVGTEGDGKDRIRTCKGA